MKINTKRKKGVVEPVKYFTNLARAEVEVIVPSRGAGFCPEAMKQLNQTLTKECSLKKYQIDSERPCGISTSKTQPVDLVVVIDTSGSMNDEANDLSTEADAAITEAMKKCPSDLRVKWFGIEKKGLGKFTESYRDYLLNIGVNATNITSKLGHPEEGGPAIVDLSQHFDWRPNASRAIFLLGDEPMKEGLPYNAIDADWRDKAIKVALDKGVKVFTYAGTPNPSDTGYEFIKDFKMVADKTLGSFFQAPASNLGGFKNILEEIICASKTKGCSPVDLPKLQPCFKIKWGDGKKDHIETDDLEVLCITAFNPYSNVTIKDLTVVVLIVVDAQNNQVPVLPDGTPSVMVKPQYLIHFGDIPPCSTDAPDKLPSVSREVVLRTRGAKEGKYKIIMAYCFAVEFTLAEMDEFRFELVPS